MDSKVVDDDDVISCLRNFDANAMATHEHCIVNARKSMRKKKLRWTIDESDFVRNNFKNDGTRQTALSMSKQRAASSLGRIWKTNITIPKLCNVSITKTYTKNQNSCFLFSHCFLTIVKILIVGHGLFPNRHLLKLSKNVNKYGAHTLANNIQTQRSR